MCSQACLRALRLLKKQFSEEIEFEYKLPKITRVSALFNALLLMSEINSE